eukprot:5230231-Amphidinium_carterae.1
MSLAVVNLFLFQFRCDSVTCACLVLSVRSAHLPLLPPAGLCSFLMGGWTSAPPSDESDVKEPLEDGAGEPPHHSEISNQQSKAHLGAFRGACRGD